MKLQDELNDFSSKQKIYRNKLFRESRDRMGIKENMNETRENLDAKLVSDFRRDLDAGSTEDLSRTYKNHNENKWPKEAFEAMRQILLAREREKALNLESQQNKQNDTKQTTDPGPAAPADTQLSKIGTKKCPYCAEEIKADAIKCRFCREFLEAIKSPSQSHSLNPKPANTIRHNEATTGTSQRQADNQRHGNESNTRKLYEAALGEKNPIYYLAKFKQFDQQPPGLKPSWNWPAFFVPGSWTLYRKMYGWFFGFLIFNIIIGSFLTYAPPWFNLIIYFVEMSLFATFANTLYQNNIKNKIGIALSIKDESGQIEFLRAKGGVHVWVIWVSILLPIVGILLAIAIPNYLALTSSR